MCSLTTVDEQHCCSNHLSDFVAGFFVPPNSIDFDYVFANLDIAKNPTIYATLIAIIVIYLVFAIWAWRKDRKDIEKVSERVMIENLKF